MMIRNIVAFKENYNNEEEEEEGIKVTEQTKEKRTLLFTYLD